MRIEWLFLRWLVIVGSIALALAYLASCGEHRAAHYETVPLIRGDKSLGSPLAGIIIDPQKRDVYAVVGKSGGKKAKGDFFILWNTTGGDKFGATFPAGTDGTAMISQISPDGEIRCLRQPERPSEDEAPPAEAAQFLAAEAKLRSIVQALPSEWDGSRAQ
ncbi:MAG TPA: hypothetical protein VF551_04875 [Chthoniobacterales bacterium]